MPTNNDSKPKKDWTVITQSGLRAQQLATAYHVELSGRLPAGLLPQLATDLVALGTAIPAAIVAHGGSEQLTSAQGGALEAGYARVSAVRLAVRRHKPAADVQKAYGVGAKDGPKVVKRVLAGLQMIVDRATAKPAEAASFGIVAADVTAMKAHLAAIKAADQTQEAGRAAAPLATKARNQIGQRILAAVDAIAAAGVLAFAESPTERALFEALVQKAG